jgi:hypothetical protein
MFEGIQLDLGTSAVLAVVYVAEGFRRVPAGAVVARRMLWSDWSADLESAPIARWRLVSYLPPFTTAIVIPAWSGDNAAGIRGARSVARTSRSVGGWRSVLLTSSSVLLLTLLILGLPAAAASRGSLGFLIALAALFLLCAVQAVLVARAISALSPVSQSALSPVSLSPVSLLRRTFPLLSPFKTPRAAEVLLEARMQRLGPIRALRGLLPRAEFDRQFRHVVYDYLISGQPNAELQTALAIDDMRALLSTSPEHDGPYCPRCGRTYVPAAGVCTTCEIGLVAGA